MVIANSDKTGGFESITKTVEGLESVDKTVGGFETVDKTVEGFESIARTVSFRGTRDPVMLRKYMVLHFFNNMADVYVLLCCTVVVVLLATVWWFGRKRTVVDKGKAGSRRSSSRTQVEDVRLARLRKIGDQVGRADNPPCPSSQSEMDRKKEGQEVGEDLYSQFSKSSATNEGRPLDTMINDEGRQVPGNAEGRQVPENAKGRQVPENAKGRQVPENAKDRQVPENAKGRQVPEPENAKGNS